MSPRAADAVEGHVDADGDRIRYVGQGTGHPVLLIHGAFGSGARLLQTAFGKGLAARHRIIAPDSLGHGDSDAPSDPARYGPRRRADQLAAVLDALGIERAHVVGYSMGGWMASALATFRPGRVASLAIGGWDVARGMYTPAAIWGLPEITYDALLAMLGETRPELVAGRDPAREAGLAAAINAMNDLGGLADGVVRCPAPTALWLGRDDLYHDVSRRFAGAHGLTFIDLPGDHGSVLEAHGAEAARRVGEFIDKAAGAPPGAAIPIRDRE
ncbi:MAG: alpha/beta fold hydrolase [Pseudomonadota bacterium]|nr:alpha/beta fold hydrolase [Pseudomonadota bacterium]